MKLNVLLWLVALLGAVLPCSADSRPSTAPVPLLPRLLLLRLGEEFSLRLGGASSLTVNRTLLQLAQRLLRLQQEQGMEDKEKRSDEAPISLDLTFHLLREVLEMARAEQLAQQADNNRKLMDDFGK